MISKRRLREIRREPSAIERAKESQINATFLGDRRFDDFDERDQRNAVIMNGSTVYRFTAHDVADVLFVNHWKRDKIYELDLLNRIRLYGRVGVYVDVGANVGNHSAFFLRECHSMALICVEPNADIIPTLARNVELNNLDDKDVSIINMGASNEAAQFAFTQQHEHNAGSCSMIAPCDRNAPTFIADVDTLDRIIAHNAPRGIPIAVIKIDVEGAERLVLDGAIETIMKHRPIVTTECANADELRVVTDFFDVIGGYVRSERLCATPTYVWAC